MSDIRFENHGSIWLACGTSDAGREWLDENVEFEVCAGRVGAVEPRYIQPIIEGAANDGLVVEVLDTPAP